MKKSIRLILLAGVAVAFLTSCDAMLETLFPKDTIGTGTTGTNVITFNVVGNDYYGPGYWTDADGLNGTIYATQRIYVRLYDQQGKLVSEQFGNFGDTTTPGPINRYVSPIIYNSLPDGNYTFEVWYDVDGTDNPAYTSDSMDGYYWVNYDDSYNSNIYVTGGQSTPVSVTLYEW